MPTETPRSPALLALVRDADRVRTEALAALLPRLQPQIVPAAAPSEAVEAVAAAQAALVMVFEQPDGQGHLDLCRAVRERFPLVATVLVRERSDRMPPRHPAIDDAVGLDHPDEMAARLDILLDVHRYNSRAPAVREGLADELRALDLSLRLLDEGRLLPPSRVAYAALVDADRLCELEAALAALGDAAVACYARAPEPTVIFSSSDQPIPGAWPCVREAMLRGTRQEAEAPDGRRLVAFPVSLSFRTVVYPLLGVCAALPGRGELAAAQRDAFLRVEQTVAEALSRQVSQRYGIAYDLLVSAVDRSEHVRAQRRRARQLLRANERLREINRLKNEFLANVSHELKTPMTSVIGFASLLLRGTAGELNEKARHFIQRILANA
ncbi:MAG: histidine kinase dimerization/phospho-acceptor domain-containing protein, partial [Planctomycetota bacterium]